MTGQKQRNKRVVVIGAGISGLMAARHLSDGGLDVTVLDKADSVGGRMATRRLGNVRIDQGVQYFHATHPIFKRHVERWNNEGVLQQWKPQPNPSSNGHAKCDPKTWYGNRGMLTLPMFLARSLKVQLNSEVVHIESQSGKWHIGVKSGDIHEADGLVITAPAPQTVALLEKVKGIPVDIMMRVRTASYQPMFALMIKLDGDSGINNAGILKLHEGPLSWIGDNKNKNPVSSDTAITVLATPEFSHLKFNENLNVVRDELLNAVCPHLASNPVETMLYRWRYAWPIQPLEAPEIALVPAPLALAGDGFGGEKSQGYMVEAAALSGIS
ncbi:MAG TPA: FAD-dependent oxidoreductase, partial [Bacteroidetes bacterium]|nr:FAD-dependent oxidoreductase [Bacteroidota bacterium]HEX03563.1 FAD-dependent oxidoreductase [Bacteroidota bacterium]